MTVKIKSTATVRQASALVLARTPVATSAMRSIAAFVQLHHRFEVDEYFLESYMVDNHDYVYTEILQ